MFNAVELAFARPGPLLVEACKALADLYLVEHAPVDVDAIYTEALPLRLPNGEFVVFKAGANLFYPAAHRTRNHDRRVPGGLLISVNSVGHLANSLVARGLAGTLTDAVSQVQDIALRSIGNGGAGHPVAQTTSWHNLDKRHAGACPMRHRPRYVPDDFDVNRYSALYHTDVLIPSAVTVDGQLDRYRQEVEVWQHLRMDYFIPELQGSQQPDYGMMRGHPIRREALYHNPWPPLHPANSAAADY